jgi:hypothetical protein
MIDFLRMTSLLLSTIILSKMFILYFKVLMNFYPSSGLVALLNSCKVVNAFNPFPDMRLSLAIWNPSSGVHFVVVAMAIPIGTNYIVLGLRSIPEMMLKHLGRLFNCLSPGFHFVTRDLRQNPLDLALLPLNW